jgi:hypothetical protein
MHFFSVNRHASSQLWWRAGDGNIIVFEKFIGLAGRIERVWAKIKVEPIFYSGFSTASGTVVFFKDYDTRPFGTQSASCDKARNTGTDDRHSLVH